MPTVTRWGSLPMNETTMRAPKYDRLVELGRTFDVPALMLVGEDELTSLFAGFGDILADADEIIERIVQTLGSFVSADMEALEGVLARLSPAGDAEAVLDGLLKPVFGADWRKGRYAVRSAAIAEDLDQQSFAGIYETELDVKGPVHILHAIASVWRSGFSRGAVLERLSGGVLGRGNPIRIIIQTMVDAELAGVAFSHDPISGEESCVVEAVAGIGDALVSGLDAGSRTRFLPGEIAAAETGPAPEPLLQVARVCAAVARHLDGPVDIEWAFADGRVHLLQARHITTLARDHDMSDGPVLAWTNLYGDDDGQIDELGPLPEFARYFRAKRKRIHDFARDHGLDRSAALLVRANGRALADAELAAPFARAFSAPDVIIDLNDQLRQIIVPAPTMIAELVRLMPDRDRIYTFVVRDFVRGEIGLITEPASDDAIIAEWTPEGLLSINRGTAATSFVRIGQAGVETGDAPPLSAGQTERLRTGTLAAQASLGPIRIEWVAEGGALYPMDFSEIGTASHIPVDGEVISHGYSEGPSISLDADTTLHALSIAPSISLTSIPDAAQLGTSFGAIFDRVAGQGEKPIVVIDRPYAVLAALLPHVSGFIFERASMLCHLAILIREHGLPAMQSPELYAMARDADALRIDTHGSGAMSIGRLEGTGVAS